MNVILVCDYNGILLFDVAMDFIDKRSLDGVFIVLGDREGVFIIDTNVWSLVDSGRTERILKEVIIVRCDHEWKWKTGEGFQR